MERHESAEKNRSDDQDQENGGAGIEAKPAFEVFGLWPEKASFIRRNLGEVGGMNNSWN